nr:hypothetical protein [Candidatus Sigynarchaeota archaeon]
MVTRENHGDIVKKPKINLMLLAGTFILLVTAFSCLGARAATPSSESLVDPADDIFGYTDGDRSSCYQNSSNYPAIDITLIEYGYVTGVGYQFNITISGTYGTGQDKDYRIYFDVNGTSGGAPSASFMDAPFIQMGVVSSTWEGRIFINISTQVPTMPQFSGDFKKATMTLADANTGWIDGIPGLLPAADWHVFGYAEQHTSTEHQIDFVNWNARHQYFVDTSCESPQEVFGFETGLLLVAAGIATVAIIVKRKD